MATALHTTNVLRLPSAASAKVKQPSWAVRARLSRDLPRILPVLTLEAPKPYRDTQKSTPLAMMMAIYAALPSDVRSRAVAFAQLIDAGSPNNFTADCLQIMGDCEAIGSAATTLATVHAERAL